MRILILDEMESVYQRLCELIDEKNKNIAIKRVKTTFAMVTHIYDEVKGDLDLLMVNITNNSEEFVMAVAAIQSYFPQIHVVFYSEHTDCAELIFEAEPTYFLKLPLSESKMGKAISRVMQHIQKDGEQLLSFRFRGQLQKIPIQSILYIESIGRKLFIYLQDDFREVNMTLDEIMSKLPERFYQCHRSYIVNLDKVTRVGSDGIVLNNNYEVPIARARMKEVKEILLNN